MNLVFLYGPQAVGKRSVGEELAKLTGFRLFDNHASLDFVSTIFGFRTPAFNELVMKFRMEMIERAAQEGISVIFTSALINGKDPVVAQAIGRLVESVEKHGGRVHFVKLYADKDELLGRVAGDSRKKFGKITDPELYKGLMRNMDLSKDPQVEGSLVIDNTHLNAAQAAGKILRHFNLPRAKVR